MNALEELVAAEVAERLVERIMNEDGHVEMTADAITRAASKIADMIFRHERERVIVEAARIVAERMGVVK